MLAKAKNLSVMGQNYILYTLYGHKVVSTVLLDVSMMWYYSITSLELNQPKHVLPWKCMELCKNEYWGFSPEILSNNILAEWEIPTVTFKNLVESLSKSQGCYSSKRIPTFNRNIQQVHIAVMVRCPQTFNHILELSEVKIWYARKYGIFMAWHPENSWENNFLMHIEQ